MILQYIKPDKEKSVQKIDGIVAGIMALAQKTKTLTEVSEKFEFSHIVILNASEE